MPSILKLEKLVCNEPEGWVTADQCRLIVSVDGGAPFQREHTLDTNETWTLSQDFSDITFENNVHVQLWDVDTADPNDYLGGTSIGTNAGQQTVTFQNADADWVYTLTYSVAAVPPPPPPPPAANQPIAIVGIEVVQVIQNPGNAVPLIEGKRTMVRAYVDSGKRDGSSTSAGPNTLVGVGGRLEEQGTNLGPPLNAGGTIAAQPVSAINRSDADHSLNFELPVVRTNGTRTFTVRAWPPGDQNNPAKHVTASVQVTFVAWGRQPITPILVSDNGVTPTLGQFMSTLGGAEARLPTPTSGFDVSAPVSLTTTADEDLSTRDGWDELLDRVDEAFDDTDLDGVGAAIVPDAGFLNGLASWWDEVFISRLGRSATFAHELAHVYGLEHSPCGNPESVDDDLPPATEVPGANVPAGTVIEAGRSDLMSYCGGQSRWPSTVAYGEMFDNGPED